MVDGRRYTLSSLLNKLRDIEEMIKDLYENLYNTSKEEDLKRLIKYIYEDTAKRIKELDWVKDFIVIEMTLEPIIGPDITVYMDNIKSITRSKIKKSSLKKIEEIRMEIYNEVLKMLRNFSPEACDVIEGFKERSINIISIL